MTPTLSNHLLTRFSDFIAEKTGLFYPRDKLKNLEKIMTSAAAEFGHQKAETCIRWILSSPDQAKLINILILYLTTGETYFFRDRHVFNALEYHVLPELIDQRRQTNPKLKIWCAGCASGEEPYSVAILLDRLIPDLKRWRISILGTDINSQSLQKAESACYGNWSFRNMPSPLLETYFEPAENNRFQLLPSIQKMVNFGILNLVNPIDYHLTSKIQGSDIIFCRNVLMYFDPVRVKQVIDSLYGYLAEDGCLIVSPAETSQMLFKQYQAETISNAVFYRKGNKAAYMAPASPIAQMSSPSESALTEIGSKIDPEITVESGLEKIRVLYAKGHYLSALEKVLVFHEKNPNDFLAIQWLIKIYTNLARFEEALRLCNKCITDDKLNPDLYFLRANVYQESNNIHEAMRDLKKVLYLDSGFILACVLLGNLNRSQARIEESNRYFNQALSLLSKSADENPVPNSEGMTAGNLKKYISILTRPDS